jgi:predicted hydrocarbon binding protein
MGQGECLPGAWRRNRAAAILRAPVTDRVDSAHSILPLSVLEAMRVLDSPSDEEVAEYVDELLKKRLGLSDTVRAQIGRYEMVVRRDGRVPTGELEQIFRLAGRRTDAALVFAEAGRRAARRALRRTTSAARWCAVRLPRFLGRLIGFGAVRRAARDVLDVTLVREHGAVTARIHHAAPVQATADGAACVFYASALGELLRQLMEFEGGMTHSRCRARGDDRCEWRAGSAAERRS